MLDSEAGKMENFVKNQSVTWVLTGNGEASALRRKTLPRASAKRRSGVAST